MKKRVVIVHCWEGYPEYCWYPYARQKLEEAGFDVVVPAFPHTEAPLLSEWLPELHKVVGDPDAQTFLVGHSVGCVAIMRYLESLQPAQKIGGSVLVAGFTDDLGYEELKNFFQTPIDYEKIKSHCNSFVLIHSDNDPYVDLKYADILKENLHGEVIVKHSAGHFSGSDNCTELPEVVNFVEKLAN